MKSGDWIEGTSPAKNFGQPLAPGTKAARLSMLRAFFRDLQDWELIPRRLNPQQSFPTPKSIIAQMGPNPRIVADEIWAKLVWAGLNFTVDDLPSVGRYGKGLKPRTCYPFELTRAVVATWLFGGLRVNEIMRLRVGCIRWQREDVAVPLTPDTLPADAVCLLDVPVNKTCAAFTKPVDRIVGEAISRWEKIRPAQPKLTDPKTVEQVDFLFLDRMRHVSLGYLNDTLIPTPCRKAGVPATDVRGRITSHRARSTIASQLYNADNG
jgi:integrase